MVVLILLEILQLQIRYGASGVPVLFQEAG